MTKEIELKFQINDDSVKPLIEFLQMQKIIASNTYQLTNTYFDTDSAYLRDRGSSVRIRGIGQTDQSTQYEITVKSAGKVIAGLHQRSEFNAQLPNEQLDLSVLPDKIWPKDTDIQWLSQRLKAQFTTHFTRQTWLIKFEHSKIEVAFDQGEICIPNTSKKTEIKELELELKSGSEHDLLVFATTLSQFNLHLFSQSKAARGYYLLHDIKLKPQHDFDDDDSLLVPFINQLLHYWQINEEYYLAHDLENDSSIDYQKLLTKVHHYFEDIFMSKQLMFSLECQESFVEWTQNITDMTSIKQFAFSQQNTDFKLNLMIFLSNHQLA